MKNVVVEAARHPSARDARVGVRRSVEFAVGSVGIDARSGSPAGPLILNAYVYESHRSPPAAGLYLDPLFRAPVCLEQPELGQSTLVRNVGDAFPVRRPARMELVVVAEAHLVRFTASDRNDI